MKYTCSRPLPEALKAALKHDDYDPGIGDYTPSSLLRPPYMAALWRQHEKDIEIDMLDRVYILQGKAIHSILEHAPVDELRMLRENRVYLQVEKWLISMQYDSLTLDTGELADYKFTTVYKFIPNFDGTMPAAPDWEFQLNVGAYILRSGAFIVDGDKRINLDPISIKSLKIWGILRDHHKSGYVRDPKRYPKSGIADRSFPIWPDEKIEEEIIRRAASHDRAKTLTLDDIQPCTDEDTWATPAKYALMKKGRKTAVKLFNSEAACKEEAEKAGKDHFVEFRPGQRKRCESYCDVAPFCPAWKEFSSNLK